MNPHTAGVSNGLPHNIPIHQLSVQGKGAGELPEPGAGLAAGAAPLGAPERCVLWQGGEVDFFFQPGAAAVEAGRISFFFHFQKKGSAEGGDFF